MLVGRGAVQRIGGVGVVVWFFVVGATGEGMKLFHQCLLERRRAGGIFEESQEGVEMLRGVDYHREALRGFEKGEAQGPVGGVVFLLAGVEEG